MVRFLAVVLAFLIASPAMGKQIKRISSGVWQGGAHVSDRTGRFSSCIVSAPYKNGILMLVMIDRNYLWDLGFSSNKWNLRVGDKIGLQFRIDTGPWTQVKATVYANNAVRVPMQGKWNAVDRFRRGRTLQLRDKNQSYFFNLTGTSRMMVRLVQCVKQQVAIDNRKGPVRTSNTPEVKSKSRTGSGTVVATAPAATTNTYNDDHLVAEGTRVLSNFIAGASLRGSTILSPTAVPESLKFAHSVATAGGQVVFVFVTPGEAKMSRQTVISSLAARVERACNGDYLSGTSKKKVTGVPVSTGFAACDRSGEVTQVRYVVTPRSSGGIYLIGMISGQGGKWGGQLDNALTAQQGIDDDMLREAAFSASR